MAEQRGEAAVADAVRRIAEEILAERICGTGIQAFVAVEDQIVVDRAFGCSADRALGASDVHAAFCLTKPLLAVAIGLAVERGRVKTTDRPAEHLEARWAAGHSTVGDILAHNAGLRWPTASQWRMTPPHQREDLLRISRPDEGHLACYSEVSGWTLLARWLAQNFGCNAEEYIRSEVLVPLQLEEELLVTREDRLAALSAGRVRVPIGGLPTEVVPMYSERLPIHVAEGDAAFGGLVSARGIGQFYRALGAVHRGEMRCGLPSTRTLSAMLSMSRSRTWDKTLRKDCRFAGGFMVGLSDHGISRLVSPEAFGHAAGVANGVGLYDPRTRVSASFFLNGTALTSEELLMSRTRLVDGVLDAAGGR